MQKTTKILSIFVLFYLILFIFLVTKYDYIQGSSSANQAAAAGFIALGAGIGLLVLTIIGLIPCLIGFYLVFKTIGSRSLHTNQEKLLAVPLVLGGIFNLIIPVFGWVAVPLVGFLGYRKGAKIVKRA